MHEEADTCPSAQETRLASPTGTVHLLLHDALPVLAAASLSLLTPQEHAAALSFYREEDRLQRLAGGIFRRVLLGGALRVAPQALRFSTSPLGKPLVAQHSVEFNVSHTREALVLAIGPNAVGVDIEHIGYAEFAWEAAETCFSVHELALLAAARAGERSMLAYALWTRKEALLKAAGSGLDVAPNTVETGVPKGGTPFSSGTLRFRQRLWTVQTRLIAAHWVVSWVMEQDGHAEMPHWSVTSSRADGAASLPIGSRYATM